MFTPYLFKSNRRKTAQEHASAKERSLMLKALRTAGPMYIPSALSYKNALRIKHQDDERVYSSPSKLCIRKVASVFVAKNITP